MTTKMNNFEEPPGNKFCWAKLPGVSVLWPVKIVDGKAADRKCTIQVYCHSDDALFKVKFTMPLEENLEEMKEKGTRILKRKHQNKTLQCFLADIAWAHRSSTANLILYEVGCPDDVSKTLDCSDKTAGEPSTQAQQEAECPDGISEATEATTVNLGDEPPSHHYVECPNNVSETSDCTTDNTTGEPSTQQEAECLEDIPEATEATTFNPGDEPPSNHDMECPNVSETSDCTTENNAGEESTQFEVECLEDISEATEATCTTVNPGDEPPSDHDVKCPNVSETSYCTTDNTAVEESTQLEAECLEDISEATEATTVNPGDEPPSDHDMECPNVSETSDCTTENNAGEESTQFEVECLEDISEATEATCTTVNPGDEPPSKHDLKFPNVSETSDCATDKIAVEESTQLEADCLEDISEASEATTVNPADDPPSHHDVECPNVSETSDCTTENNAGEESTQFEVECLEDISEATEATCTTVNPADDPPSHHDVECPDDVSTSDCTTDNTAGEESTQQEVECLEDILELTVATTVNPEDNPSPHYGVQYPNDISETSDYETEAVPPSPGASEVSVDLSHLLNFRRPFQREEEEDMSIDECDSDSDYNPSSSESEDDESEDDMSLPKASTSSTVQHLSVDEEECDTDSDNNSTSTKYEDDGASSSTANCATGDDALKPSAEEIQRDSKVPSIYIRKITTSLTTCSGKKKKRGRVQNSCHACLYCGKLVQHIPSHTKSKHTNEKEVKEIIELVRKGKLSDTSTLNDMLRAKGDHKHNLKVVKDKKGEMLIYRRPQANFDHEKYGPCPKCLDWMLLQSLPKHQKTCPGYKFDSEEHDIPRKRELLFQSDILVEKINMSASPLLKKEVFSMMTPDKVSKVAQNDLLIVALGESWLKRNIDNETKRKYYASQHMRHCAKLLLYTREQEAKADTSAKETPEKQMWDYLRPAHVDKVVEAALDTAVRKMDDEEELKSPSNAIKIKYDLVRMAHTKAVISVKELDKDRGSEKWKEAKQEADDFLTSIKHDWSERVTRLARKILNEKKLNTVEQLPKPEDVGKLSKHLREKLTGEELYEGDITWTQYQQVAQYTQARLLTFNKRRSGELEAIHLKSYLQRKSVVDVDSGLMGQLNETEQYLLEKHDLLETRGKVGHRVPVVIPEDCQRALAYLADSDTRNKAGVKRTNKYIFPNCGDSILRAYESLKKVCKECNLDTPGRITSVSMRKYMATLTQVMDLNSNQMEWVCKHLGHSKDVHLNYYRVMSPFLERVEIGKLLLMQDLNIQSNFVGKSLRDVDFSEIISKQTSAPGCSQAPSAAFERVSSGEEQGDLDFEEVPRKKRKTAGNKSQRQPWSKKEQEELQSYLHANFESKVTPGKAECEKAIELSRQNGGELHRRNWRLIVKKVSYILHKVG